MPNQNRRFDSQAVGASVAQLSENKPWRDVHKIANSNCSSPDLWHLWGLGRGCVGPRCKLAKLLLHINWHEFTIHNLRQNNSPCPSSKRQMQNHSYRLNACILSHVSEKSAHRGIDHLVLCLKPLTLPLPLAPQVLDQICKVHGRNLPDSGKNTLMEPQNPTSHAVVSHLSVTPQHWKVIASIKAGGYEDCRPKVKASILTPVQTCSLDA